MAQRSRGVWWNTARGLFYPAMWVSGRHLFLGLENLPADGPALVVANHISYIDPLTFARFVWDAQRVPRFLAKASLFNYVLIGSVLRGSGQIPVHRGTADARSSLRDAVAALEQGEVVCIYPEGTVTRDPDWWPMQSKTGVARLALAADVPVIPVAQWGPQDAVDWYAKKIRLLPRKTVVCRAGPPVDLSAYRGRPVTAELLREVTDVLMGAVRDLLGEVRGQAPPHTFWRQEAPGPAEEAS